jgi:hypothetical protein
MYQQFREVLYHGTVSEITSVDVTRGRDKKDFGKGFYIAESKSPAVGMMHKKQREAVRRSRNKNNVSIQEYLYEITLDTEYMKNLDIKVFERADDDTMLCLRAYWDGLYGSGRSFDCQYCSD